MSDRSESPVMPVRRDRVGRRRAGTMGGHPGTHPTGPREPVAGGRRPVAGPPTPSAEPAGNGSGDSLVGQLSRRLWSLDAPGLCAEAQRRTGLTEFDQPPVEPALSVLLRSTEREANLHPLGRFLARLHFRDLLETRLRLAGAWRRGRNGEEPGIREPIFVTGMPRSGSTFLHELLAQDPAHRAPEVWEVMFPLAAGGSEPGRFAPPVRKAAARLWWFRRLAPQADSVYPLRARTPHECVAIHSYTLMSQEFVSAFRIPSYEAFLDAADLSPVYAFERRFLQHLQGTSAPRRWVLKSPDHVRSLEALWRVFPDAIVIQTHRPPLPVLASSSHLTEVLRRTFGRPDPRARIGRREAEVLADNMDRITRFRDAHPGLADRFVDVHYHELVTDPLATVRRVYARLGLRLGDEVAQRMQELAARRQRYGGREARPTLAELGLDPRQVADRFRDYCSRYGVRER